MGSLAMFNFSTVGADGSTTQYGIPVASFTGFTPLGFDEANMTLVAQISSISQQGKRSGSTLLLHVPNVPEEQFAPETFSVPP